MTNLVMENFIFFVLIKVGQIDLFLFLTFKVLIFDSIV